MIGSLKYFFLLLNKFHHILKFGQDVVVLNRTCFIVAKLISNSTVQFVWVQYPSIDTFKRYLDFVHCLLPYCVEANIFQIHCRRENVNKLNVTSWFSDLATHFVKRLE